MGLYPDPRGRAIEIPGLEYSGVVSAVGADVSGWAVGDRAMGIEAGGCYAEKVATHARQALPVPTAVSSADAAAIPEVFLTAWDALVVQGGLTSGRWALVHAGASGVGTAAIQIAKAIGARIAVTCSAGKAQACRDLGADIVLERSPADWLGELRAAIPGGVDVVLDVIGGDEVDRNLQACRMDGTIIQVGLMGGGSASVNVGLILGKRITWIGTTLRARPLERKLALSQRFIDEVLPLFEAGQLRPVIDSRYPFDGSRTRTATSRPTPTSARSSSISDRRARDVHLVPGTGCTSGGADGGWAGGLGGAVGVADGELPVGSECHFPSRVVDVVVVSGADGQEVVEVGAAAVSPPDDVVEFAVVVAHPAAGDRTGRVQPAECSALGPVRQACGAAEVRGCRGRAARPRYGPRRCGRRRHRRVRRGPATGPRRGSRTPCAGPVGCRGRRRRRPPGTRVVPAWLALPPVRIRSASANARR